jgi:recombination protein RecT
MSTQLTTRDFFAQKQVQSKFAEMLGKRATQFITSVMQVTSSNDLLAKATPQSIYGAAVTAAVLDLPIQNNLGFAYIVPYGNQAQFQLGYKGLIQLALRSGQFKNISVAEIYEGQIVSENPLTGYVFDFSKKTSDKVIGYAAYFSLLNGFEKTEYMSKEKLDAHGKKFSQTYKKGFGVWKDDFDSMAKKTVLKLTLSKYAPLSVEMQKAITFDQAVTNDGEVVEFVDNTETIDASAEDMKAAGEKLAGGLFNDENK